jgi:hypothetical protein
MKRPSSTAATRLRSAVPAPGPPLAEGSSAAPLTRVSLAFIEQRINLYLRFGRPQREQTIDHWQRCAFFASGACFARILWQANDYGTTRWQLLVLQACTPRDRMHRIPGIRPGARILLHVEGERRVRQALAQIDAIEALGIHPVDVAPAYWRTLGNRLAARLPPPIYTIERHSAWLAVRRLS